MVFSLSQISFPWFNFGLQNEHKENMKHIQNTWI